VNAPALAYRLRSELELQLALSELRRAELLTGVGETERATICTIAAELGSNMLKFARGGELRLSRRHEAGAELLEVAADDEGPGIANVGAAVSDHYSTAGTLGLGLSAVVRMADQVHIETGPGLGCSVRALTWLGAGAPPRRERLTERRRAGPGPAALALSWASENRPCRGQQVSGDAVVFRPLADGRLVVVLIDACGHGLQAHALATRLAGDVAAQPAPEVAGLVDALHHACRGSAGAAAGVASLDPVARVLSYAAVGNVRARLVGAAFGEPGWRGVSRDGLLGDRCPPPFVQQTRLSPGQMLLLYSDGVSESLHAFRGRLAGTVEPAGVARAVVSQCGCDDDDAACAAVRLA
jgi:anti-sigma regulatory factor (Ser/Thr protein kinase)